jgi:hypothetical protein
LKLTNKTLKTLPTLTTTELEGLYGSLSDKDKEKLNEWLEDYAGGYPNGTGNYKLELCLDNLYSLMNPSESLGLKEYSQEDEQEYLQNWTKQYQKKQDKWYQYWGGPWKQDDGTYYTQNPWCKTTWKLDEEGNPTDLKTTYKYLPGPLCLENWNEYEWKYGKTGYEPTDY